MQELLKLVPLSGTRRVLDDAAASRMANLAGADGSEDEETESPESLRLSNAKYGRGMCENVSP